MARSLSVVAIVAAYNEEDIIEEVVRALIDEGIRVYFLDNHSTDGTLEAVRRIREPGLIGTETFPPAGASDEAPHIFAWEPILRRKEELARDLEADWFIHHDADEFRESPWSGVSLRDAIADVDAAGYNAIDFQVLNFRPTTVDPARTASVRERLQFYEPGRTWDRVQIKCWKKTSQPVVLAASGGHSAEFAGRHIFPIRFLLRHYPIRSQAHGDRKVLHERLPRFSPEERARGWHVQYDDLDPRQFVRDPASLIRYDAERVRLDLFLLHRGVEALEQVVAANQDLADRLTDDGAALRRHLQSQDAELDRLRGERGHQLSQIATLRDEREHLRGDLTARETTIEYILASRSWRLAAPLRAADRLVRVRSAGSTGRGLAVANLPIGGGLQLASDVSGFWGDGWAGCDVRFRARASRRLGGIRISGTVPAALDGGQDLRLRIHDQEWTHHAGPGRFDWRVPVAVDVRAVVPISVSASRSWRPSSGAETGDTRELAWLVTRIEGD